MPPLLTETDQGVFTVTLDRPDRRNAVDGQALAAAQALARELAAFPQRCMNADRASAIAQWDWPLADALRREAAQGHTMVFDEGLAGAARFAAGAGRHGGRT